MFSCSVNSCVCEVNGYTIMSDYHFNFCDFMFAYPGYAQKEEFAPARANCFLSELTSFQKVGKTELADLIPLEEDAFTLNDVFLSPELQIGWNNRIESFFHCWRKCNSEHSFDATALASRSCTDVSIQHHCRLSTNFTICVQFHFPETKRLFVMKLHKLTSCNKLCKYFFLWKYDLQKFQDL